MGEQVEPGGPLFCARCTRELHPGSGDFFEVRIEAVADPSPPNLGDPASPAMLGRQIHQLIGQLGDLSEQEAMDQVHRRLVIHLCQGCFQGWVENPAG